MFSSFSLEFVERLSAPEVQLRRSYLNSSFVCFLESNWVLSPAPLRLFPPKGKIGLQAVLYFGRRYLYSPIELDVLISPVSNKKNRRARKQTFLTGTLKVCD